MAGRGAAERAVIISAEHSGTAHETARREVFGVFLVKVVRSAIIGVVLGAGGGVVLIGLLGMLSGVAHLVDHADDLSYGLSAFPGGFVMFAYHIGIPVGAPVGAVLGVLIGVAIGRREPRSPGAADPRTRTRVRRLGALCAAIVLIAVAAILYRSVVVPIMERRRELASIRAQGDRIEREVARLGGRPFHEPGLSRMIDLDNTNVTDEDLIKLSELEEFRLVDRILLSHTRVTDRFVKTLKRGEFSLQSLDLSGTQVTDESLAHLVRIGLPLNWFSFAGTRVTDAGLALIPDGTRIDLADFRGSRVTEAGVRKLFERTRVTNRIEYGDPGAPKQLSR
jgi:hypothetical protein